MFHWSASSLKSGVIYVHACTSTLMHFGLCYVSLTHLEIESRTSEEEELEGS